MLSLEKVTPECPAMIASNSWSACSKASPVYPARQALAVAQRKVQRQRPEHGTLGGVLRQGLAQCPVQNDWRQFGDHAIFAHRGHKPVAECGATLLLKNVCAVLQPVPWAYHPMLQAAGSEFPLRRVTLPTERTAVSSSGSILGEFEVEEGGFPFSNWLRRVTRNLPRAPSPSWRCRSPRRVPALAVPLACGWCQPASERDWPTPPAWRGSDLGGPSGFRRQ